MNEMNPIAIFLIAFNACLGDLLLGNWVIGATVGLGIVLVASFLEE